MLGLLLLKDLRRARRNPWPWLINLLAPLVLTALIGLVFGGRDENGPLGRIHFGVVDEDQSVVGRALRGLAGQGQGSQYLEPEALERTAALRELQANQLSAVLIIPTNFTRDYFAASNTVRLELIKNPAESIHPAVLEELLGVGVAGLNALARNFGSEFPAWQSAWQEEPDFAQMEILGEAVLAKMRAARHYLRPPLVTYETTAAAGAGQPPATGSGNADLFAFLLLGLAAMFLLFIASNAMTDLHREISLRTLARLQTLHAAPATFLAAKVVYVVVLLLACTGIMLGGGSWIFHIHWVHPFALATLVAGYAAFIGGWYALVAAWLPDERRGAIMSNLSGMALGLMGGCAFPPNQLPAFIHANVTPWLPSFWFVHAARNLQLGGSADGWGWVVLHLVLLSLALTALAGRQFSRRFTSGTRV